MMRNALQAIDQLGLRSKTFAVGLRGCDVEEVTKYLARLADAAAIVRSNPGVPPALPAGLSPVEIRQKEFTQVWRGYEREEVKAYLARASSLFQLMLDKRRDIEAATPQQTQQAPLATPLPAPPAGPGGPKVWRSPKVEVRQGSTEGRGIFATAPIAAGEIVAVKVGHVVNTNEANRLTAEIGDFSLQIHDDVFLTPRTADEIDDMVVMINHSCDANVGFEGQVYVAIRDIPAGEELCHDYAMARTQPYTLHGCRCGTAVCRGTITHEDWRLPDVQARYGRFFMPHVLRRIVEARRSEG